ncbi:hypothetical protein PXW85_26760, partial [Klebsiella pneumoniae]|nr:hypothetical protein [Klebsiella pneumoniae]
DAAIRYRETPEPDLYCTLLYEDRFIVVASPTLGLSRPEDLQRSQLLFGLYTFRHNAHMQALSHADNQADDIQIVFLLRNID